MQVILHQRNQSNERYQGTDRLIFSVPKFQGRHLQASRVFSEPATRVPSQFFIPRPHIMLAPGYSLEHLM